MQKRIKEHDRDIQLTQTLLFLNTPKRLGTVIKWTRSSLIYWLRSSMVHKYMYGQGSYRRRLHPNNIKVNEIEIPEAWIPMTKIHNNSRMLMEHWEYWNEPTTVKWQWSDIIHAMQSVDLHCPRKTSNSLPHTLSTAIKQGHLGSHFYF